MQATGEKQVEVSGLRRPSIKKGISTNAIKIIAIIAMLIDHITWDYVPSDSLQGQLLHIIGRLTAPIMSFFVVEGFFHTHNMKKYVGRLFLFSIVSYFAYQFHTYGEFFSGFRYGSIRVVLTNSVIFTLLLGLLTLIVWYKTDWNTILKILCVVVCCFVAIFSDWACIVVLWVFFMGINHGNFKAQMISLAAIGCFFAGVMLVMGYLSGSSIWWVNLCQFGIVFAIPILYLYSGKLGKSKNLKWLFYIFYPLHLFILGFIKFYILG